MPATAPPSARLTPWVVLDTNVVLDLWLFGDSRSAALRHALQTGALTALVTQPMLAELADVLARPFAQGWPVPPAQALASLQTSAQLVDPPPVAAQPAPRCTDPDDQKFIDLAWHWPAAWLFSRDRAVLRLARSARLHGLHIGTPEAWSAQLTAH